MVLLDLTYYDSGYFIEQGWNFERNGYNFYPAFPDLLIGAW